VTHLRQLMIEELQRRNDTSNVVADAGYSTESRQLTASR
jgi:hypothetical protein